MEASTFWKEVAATSEVPPAAKVAAEITNIASGGQMDDKSPVMVRVQRALCFRDGLS